MAGETAALLNFIYLLDEFWLHASEAIQGDLMVVLYPQHGVDIDACWDVFCGASYYELFGRCGSEHKLPASKRSAQRTVDQHDVVCDRRPNEARPPNGSTDVAHARLPRDRA